MAKLEKRITKWGWLAQVVVEYKETVTDGVSVYEDETVAEVMHFYRPGKFHTHDKWEVIRCVAGDGVYAVKDEDGNEQRFRATELGKREGLFRVAPGQAHRMEPDPGGMTCVLWYE